MPSSARPECWTLTAMDTLVTVVNGVVRASGRSLCTLGSGR